MQAQTLTPARIGARSALATVATLCGAVLVVFGISFVVNTLVPAAPSLGPAPFYVLLFVGCLAGGRVWAGWLTRIAGVADGGRAAAAGALGFAASITLAASGLTMTESRMMLLAQDGLQLPAHLAFGVLFPAATLLVVGLTALALGGALGGVRAGSALALRCGLAAALAFLLVDLAFDLAGWRVGGPGAEARFTMLTVFALGSLAAALVGGAMLGRGVARLSAPAPGRRPAATALAAGAAR